MNYDSKEFWVDGGCLMNGRENSTAYGSYSDGNKVIRLKFPEAKTNNEAEYDTLIALLNALAIETGNEGMRVYTDSKLLVGQLTMGWKVKAQNLQHRHELAANLLEVSRVLLLWVPREQIVEKLGH